MELERAIGIRGEVHLCTLPEAGQKSGVANRSKHAGVAELVDARGLNPLDLVHSGSSPDTRTKTAKSLFTIG